MVVSQEKINIFSQKNFFSFEKKSKESFQEKIIGGPRTFVLVGGENKLNIFSKKFRARKKIKSY